VNLKNEETKMKRYIIAFLICLLLISFSSVSALDLKGKFAVSGNGALVIPVGDLADKEKGAVESGFGLYGTAEYFITDNIGLGGFFAYYSLGIDNEAQIKIFESQYQLPVEKLDLTQKGINFGVHGRYLFDVHEKAAPYVKAGAGFTKPKVSGDIGIGGLDSEIEGDYDTKFLFFGGGGLLYRVSPNVGVNLEALFMHGFTDGAEGDLTIGDEKLTDKVTFNSQAFQISAGVVVFFGGKQ
jgi:opacity protein-like surface antigen